MLPLVAALVAGVAARVAAADCLYAGYTSTFVSSTCTQPGAVLCSVDSSCKLNKMFWTKDDVKKDSTQTNLLVINGTYKAQYLAELPNLSQVYIQFYNSVRAVGDLSKDTNVALLDFEANKGIDLSKAAFSPIITRLSIAACQLPTLPTTIPYGQLSEFYGWQNNFTTIENVNFRNAVEIKFNGCPYLTTLSNLTVSSKLSKFYFDDSHFTTFLIDQPTYAALQAVPTFAVGSIDVAATCKAPNTIQLLKTKYSVCVMPAPATEDSGSSSNTGLIVGVAVGAVVLVLAIVGFVLYRRKKNAASTGTSHTGYTAHNTTTQGMTTSTGQYSMAFNMEDLELLRLDEQALTKVQSVAQGAYGEVYRGEYKVGLCSAEVHVCTGCTNLYRYKQRVQDLRCLLALCGRSQ
ncbi:hypothetical protein, variant [Saprolegnia diclina VS20]|uniref:Protein kinase domain-containing protein n=1 Tax=Saprolegnia diclina (strain VS20) TaxID=1156394 RepID=T0RD90_SAPDV|nr:hypothetical protein, variant [Saprolegnia diclina VS20]EQC27537.1 hypothetical protein, variant [Saprolegnia diclina VS20]|eukprot:XP_008618957.1 hypothetical protein, variant [Saprolegnia diclina VS20]